MTIQQGEMGFLVTPAQMYAEMRSLHETVVRMDSKIDNLGQQSTEIGDHESRLRLLEATMWRAAGAAAVVGAGVGVVAQFMMR